MVDILFKIASSKAQNYNKTIIHKILTSLNTTSAVNAIGETNKKIEKFKRITSLISYIIISEVLEDKKEA